jgi:hypothetical protein
MAWWIWVLTVTVYAGGPMLAWGVLRLAYRRQRWAAEGKFRAEAARYRAEVESFTRYADEWQARIDRDREYRARNRELQAAEAWYTAIREKQEREG